MTRCGFITHYLASGQYRTMGVDMRRWKLVFRKPVPGGGKTSEAPRAGPFQGIFGALAGTVTFAPGTDPTAPTGEEWDAAK